MYCRECGNVMDEADKFCPACGSKTPPAQTQAAPAASSPPPLSTQPTQSAGSSMDFSMAGIKGNLEKLGEDKNIFLIGAAALVLSLILTLTPIFSMANYGIFGSSTTVTLSMFDAEVAESGPALGIVSFIGYAISIVMYLLPLVKGTYRSGNFISAKIVTIVITAYFLLNWLIGGLLNVASLGTAEIALTFTGWLFFAVTITSVVLSFLVPSKLRKKGFL